MPPPWLHRLGHAQALGCGGDAAGSACPHPGSLFNIALGPRRHRRSPSLGGPVPALGRAGDAEINSRLFKGKVWCGVRLCRGFPRAGHGPSGSGRGLVKGPIPIAPISGGELRPRHCGSGGSKALARRRLYWDAPHRRAPLPPPRGAPLPAEDLPPPTCSHLPTGARPRGSSPPRVHPLLARLLDVALPGDRKHLRAAAPALTPAGPSFGVRRVAPGPGWLRWVPRPRQGLSGSSGTGGGTSVR